jgi:hypothetical protein
MFKKDTRLRRFSPALFLVFGGVAAFLFTHDFASQNEVANAGAARSHAASASNMRDVGHPETSSEDSAMNAQAGRPVYGFETPMALGRPTAIPARFETPSAAEATLRSARLAELIPGGLSALRQGDTIQLPLPDSRFVSGRINVVQCEADGQVLVGGELTDVRGSFSLGEDESRLGGVILPAEGTVAYSIETGRDGAAYLLEKNKDAVVCIEFPVVVVSRAVVRAAQGQTAEGEVTSSSTESSQLAASEYLLSSRPTATAVAYLDFDGETVTDSYWNNGNTIAASSSGLSAAQITEVWQRVTEDYRPFNIDVTTDRSRYDNAPAGSRIRCIVTQSSSWYGSAGGVAYIGSWSASGSGGMSSTIPCWVFSNLLSLNMRYVAEAISHEIGHTLGLSHDGLRDSSGNVIQNYYSGHGSGATSWAPIMGSGYYSSVVQWSAGNYGTNGNVGSNTEDDLAIIASASNRAGYMADDAGNIRSAASALRFSSGSTVSTTGLIERSGDVDTYGFTCADGGVTFTLVPEFSGLTGVSNLDARAILYDASGNTVADSNPTGSLFPSISATLSAGTYYLAIVGVGEGAVPGTGYTNYGSLGRYQINGTVISSSAAAPVITSSNSGSAVRGQAFSHLITASNFPTSYSASGLPSGLLINTGTGLISGTVSTGALLGNYSVILSATNSAGIGAQTFTLNVSDPVISAPVITSAGTGSAVIGSAFSYQIAAGNSPTSYAASGLPSGLSVNASSGLISGIVSTTVTAGVYAIELRATNAGGTGIKTLALTINAPTTSGSSKKPPRKR